MLCPKSTLLPLACLIAACQPAPSEQREDRVGKSDLPRAPAPKPSQPTQFPQSPATPAPTAPGARSPKVEPAVRATSPKLAVDGEGLRLVAKGSGSTRQLAFGLSSEAVLGPLERLRGPADKGLNAECGSNYANWADGLSLNFRRDKLVGWTLDGRAEGAITTMAGLGTGSTKETLGAYDYKLARTSLGQEFTAGDLHGLLASTAADAKITYLWAGEVCLAR
jgi:hypothetical protein